MPILLTHIDTLVVWVPIDVTRLTFLSHDI